MSEPTLYEKLYLKHHYNLNRLKFARLKRNLRGRVEFGEGCDIWVNNFRFKGAGRLSLGRSSVLERSEFPMIFETEKGGEIILGERCYLRCKYCANVLTVFENGRIEIGDDSGLNGCIITAKNHIKIGRRALLGWGVTILDSDLHNLSNTRKERVLTVEIGDYVMIPTYTTIMPGVKIGSHCIIGSNSVVTRDIPDHSIAAGAPARIIGRIDDRNLST